MLYFCCLLFVPCHYGLGYRICTIYRWWWPLRAGCGLYRPGSPSIPLGRANRQFRCWNWAAYSFEEMALRGAGRSLTTVPCMFSVLQYMWSFENKKLICFDSYIRTSRTRTSLNSHMCHAGGQFVCKPRSRGFTRTDGVPARMWLCYSALLLDTAGLQWLWRGCPCHSWEVKPESTIGFGHIKTFRLFNFFSFFASQWGAFQRCHSTSHHWADTQQECFHTSHRQHK